MLPLVAAIALHPWPLLLLSVSGFFFRVLEHCVVLFLLLCAQPCLCQCRRDSESAASMLGWRNEHIDSGFKKRPEKMWSPMHGVHGRDGGVRVVDMLGAGGI